MDKHMCTHAHTQTPSIISFWTVFITETFSNYFKKEAWLFSFSQVLVHNF